jgi:hypothetical protein
MIDVGYDTEVPDAFDGYLHFETPLVGETKPILTNREENVTVGERFRRIW